jgi:lysozyme family protein
VAAPARGLAEELQQEFQQDLSDFSDATLTQQQWRERVEDARRRSEAFVAQARSHTIHSVQSDQEDPELTDQLAMNDPSLKPGDIVSTSQGLLVFIGRDGLSADRTILSGFRKPKWNRFDGWSAN